MRTLNRIWVLLTFISLVSFTGFAQKAIEIYTMPGCGRCAYALKYLKNNKIKYVEHSTANDKDNDKMWEIVRSTGNYDGGSISMPVIIKDGVTSFNIEDLEVFMANIGGTGNNHNNNNNNTNNQVTTKKTGCISGDCVNGNGVYKWENGDTYSGDFVDGQITGQGKYIWANGSSYDGGWSNTLQNGYGVYVDENGTESSGNWVNGVLQSQEQQENENNNVSSANLSNDQIKEFVDRHNYWRGKVHSPNLTWSNELAQYAQEWGNHLAETGCDMEHRPRNGQWAQKYGENLYWCSGMEATPSGAVDDWASEKSLYDGGVMNNKNFAAGHYTQIIWAKTTQVGCAIVQCKDGAYLVVCNYNPAGNYMGVSPMAK